MGGVGGIRGRQGVEQLIDFLGLQRVAEVEALAQVTAHLTQLRQLSGVFDALGHHRLAQRVAQLHHRAHHGGLLRATAQTVDERAVDLQAVDGQRGQVAQGRVTGAEVVDAQADAQGAQLFHQRHGVVNLLHEDVFGQLQRQVLGADARFQ